MNDTLCRRHRRHDDRLSWIDRGPVCINRTSNFVQSMKRVHEKCVQHRPQALNVGPSMPTEPTYSENCISRAVSEELAGLYEATGLAQKQDTLSLKAVGGALIGGYDINARHAIMRPHKKEIFSDRVKEGNFGRRWKGRRGIYT